ncbi:MAG: dihydrodipicolinate synthase family protein [Bryobacterales bacterium]|jgi:dihydrodipicolinate synthase/N-acetylneuraminate lyase|nr:dihydrodipicolinate synthase family protein [Bryobacterales bacterium]
MNKNKIDATSWQGVLPVPPLPRRRDAARSLDFEAGTALARHIVDGGITRLIYGGNAFLYHITLAEYDALLEWMTSLDDSVLAIPSAGPSYGRAMDQAPVLRKYGFPVVMLLPCGDPRDARGLEAGYREFADAAETPLLVYLKDENNFGSNKEAGLDAVARLVDDGVCVGIKYAVVRENPAEDAYLDALLQRVDRAKVISGIGERPAIIHMRDFRLPGFTTGSGCLAPRMSNELFHLCTRGEYHAGEAIRAEFLPVEDLRDAWGPARVLHAAIELAGVCPAGPVPPYVSELSEEQKNELAEPARALAGADKAVQTGAASVS